MVRRLSEFLKPYWARLTAAFVAMAGVAAISTGTAWLMKYLVDEALTNKDWDSLVIGIWVILSIFTLKSILWYSHTYLTAYVGQSIAREIRDKAYRHLYTLSMAFFNDKRSSSILARLTNDVTTLQVALASAPTIMIRDGLTIIGLIGFLFYLNLKFSLICFSILPVSGFFLYHLGKKSRRAGREGQARMSDMYASIQESISAMPIVKTYQNEDREISDFKQDNRNFFSVIMKLVRVEARSSPIMEVLGSIILALMLYIGGRDVINGIWSLGSFVAFIGAAMSLYNPIKKFAKVNVQIQQGLAAGERVFELLDQKATVTDAPDAKPAGPFSSEIRFNDVAFQYPTGAQVLHNINFELKKGEIIALVGPSGSGKSTLAQLLLRFYDPTAGSIEFDGVDARKLTVQSLRKQIGIVTQETHLFNDTIAANIAYGNPQATEEQIIEAAKAANAHEFISALQNGYQTVIGERGTRISGGERQRLAIARAIIKNPQILILDEATSALDAKSEQAVQAAFDQLLVGRTVLMIAHRLSTVRKANRILVLENGRIKQSGTHEDLIKTQGTYRQLYDLQAVF